MSKFPEVGMTKVWAGLWVGAGRAVTPELLDAHAVAVLVWATPEVDPPTLKDDVQLLRVNVVDAPDQDLSPYFPLVAQAFKQCQDDGRSMVVVCRAGVSRSASLALAALLANTDPKLSLRQLYQAVKEARPFIRPNSGFFSQLIKFEVEVQGKASVRMVDLEGERVPDIYLEEISREMSTEKSSSFYFKM